MSAAVDVCDIEAQDWYFDNHGEYSPCLKNGKIARVCVDEDGQRDCRCRWPKERYIVDGDIAIMAICQKWDGEAACLSDNGTICVSGGSEAVRAHAPDLSLSNNSTFDFASSASNSDASSIKRTQQDGSSSQDEAFEMDNNMILVIVIAAIIIIGSILFMTRLAYQSRIRSRAAQSAGTSSSTQDPPSGPKQETKGASTTSDSNATNLYASNMSGLAANFLYRLRSSASLNTGSGRSTDYHRNLTHQSGQQSSDTTAQGTQDLNDMFGGKQPMREYMAKSQLTGKSVFYMDSDNARTEDKLPRFRDESLRHPTEQTSDRRRFNSEFNTMNTGNADAIYSRSTISLGTDRVGSGKTDEYLNSATQRTNTNNVPSAAYATAPSSSNRMLDTWASYLYGADSSEEDDYKSSNQMSSFRSVDELHSDQTWQEQNKDEDIVRL